MPGISGAEALKLVQKLWKQGTEKQGFDRILQKVTITSAGNGSCTAEFKVDEGLLNKMGTLHGGCTATMIDCISTLGLLTHDQQKPGLSINLSINYLSAASLGTVVELESKTVKCGRTLAFLEAVLKDKGTGKIIATGTHIKFVGS